MKKTLIAVAALAATGAFAQSAVNLTGAVGFAYQSVDSSANVRVNGLAMTDAVLAVTVSEDLGGGMTASANMTFDTGGSQFNTAGNFNRRNTSMALSGGFGRFSMANTRSSDLMINAFVAPASLSDGIYDTSGVIGRSPIDILTYTTPSFSGFTASLSYVESGTTAAVTPGYAVGQGDGGNLFTTTTTVIGLNYANGPLAGGLAFKSSAYNSLYSSASFTVVGGGVLATSAANNIARNTNAEGFLTYDFGVAKVGLGFDTGVAGVVSTTTNDATAWSFGVAAPFGPVTVGVNWAQRDVNTMYEAVVKYDLSKRTALNFSFGRQSFDSVAGGNTDGSQYRIGMLHSF